MPALILMYHDIAEGELFSTPEHRPYLLDKSTFSNQMEAVAQTGFDTQTVTEWSGQKEPKTSVLITFDDGHISSYDLAFPILLENRLKATFFVTAGFVGKGSTMNWKQLRELRDAGMEIGSHTLTHRPPRFLNDGQLRFELVESRRILEDGLGCAVTSISSPTGFLNVRMSHIAREVGYRCVCFGTVGLARETQNLFSLNRVAVKAGMTSEEFSRLLRFDQNLVRVLRFHQWVRDCAKTALGKRIYLGMRRTLLRAKSGL